MPFIISIAALWTFISIFSYAIAAFSDNKIRNLIGISLFLLMLILILPASTPRQSTNQTNLRPYYPFYNCYILVGCLWEKHDQTYPVNYKNDLPNWIIRLVPPFLAGTILGLITKERANAKIKSVR